MYIKLQEVFLCGTKSDIAFKVDEHIGFEIASSLSFSMIPMSGLQGLQGL